MILTFNTTDRRDITDRRNTIGPQSIDELKIKATFEPLLKSLLKEPFEPLLKLLIGFLTFLFKEVLVDSIDGLYSIADSALHWFLENEYEEIHDILATFDDLEDSDDPNDPNDPENNSDEDDQEIEEIEEIESEEDPFYSGIVRSYEDQEIFELENKRLRKVETFGEKQERKDRKERYQVVYEALERQRDLGSLTPEFLETRIFSNKDVLMIQWLCYLLKDSNDMENMKDMNTKFSKPTMRLSDLHLCFGKTFYQAFIFYQYDFSRPESEFDTVYYKAVLRSNPLIYFYGLKEISVD